MDTLELADLSGILVRSIDDAVDAGVNYNLQSGKNVKEELHDLMDWDPSRAEFVRATHTKRKRAARALRKAMESLNRLAPNLNFISEKTVSNSLMEHYAVDEEWLEYTLLKGGTALNAVIDGNTCSELLSENWKSWAATVAQDFGRAWNADGTIFTNMEQTPGMWSRNVAGSMWNPDTQDFGDRGRSNRVNL